MGALRKTVSTIFIILAMLSLFVMFSKGFELAKMGGVICWLCTAAALRSIGGKTMRIIGYITSVLILIFCGVFLQVTLTLEPNSSDFASLFSLALLGMTLPILAIWGIYTSDELGETPPDV